MQISIFSGEPTATKADLVVYGVYEGRNSGNSAFDALSKELGKSFKSALKKREFTGKRGQNCALETIESGGILVAGLGDGETISTADWIDFAGSAARTGDGQGAKSVVVILPDTEAPLDGVVELVARGSVMGTYRFNNYKTKSNDCNIRKLQIGLGSGKLDSADRKALGASAERGTIIADGVCTARDLVNEPPSELYPESFADRAKAMSQEHGLKVKVIGPAQLKKMGANLILAVGQGSVQKPRLVHMTYTPDNAEDRKKKPIVFVGKGITFDSGGLCLKPAGGMLDMKMDMGGAAAVTGAMHAIARLKPNVPVHGILSCAENMPAGNAYRLGDVVTGMSGTTVEINNTDAEGRLVLADALHYATALEPECIIDLATLTGAIVVALGGSVGLFSNSDELAGDLLMHSDNAGEHFWRMPLTEKLKDMLKSDIADTKNTGERAGGSITAALFLQKFIGENNWAHLDIAGAAYGSSTAGASTKGGSGAAVATLVGLATADA